jgi:hypothetical protein
MPIEVPKTVNVAPASEDVPLAAGVALTEEVDVIVDTAKSKYVTPRLEIVKSKSAKLEVAVPVPVTVLPLAVSFKRPVVRLKGPRDVEKERKPLLAL